MFKITKKTVCPIGKYREQTFEEISAHDAEYIGWFVQNIPKLPNLGTNFRYSKWFYKYQTAYVNKKNQAHSRYSENYDDEYGTSWADDVVGGYSPDFF